MPFVSTRWPTEGQACFEFTENSSPTIGTIHWKIDANGWLRICMFRHMAPALITTFSVAFDTADVESELGTCCIFPYSNTSNDKWRMWCMLHRASCIVRPGAHIQCTFCIYYASTLLNEMEKRELCSEECATRKTTQNTEKTEKRKRTRTLLSPKCGKCERNGIRFHYAKNIELRVSFVIFDGNAAYAISVWAHTNTHTFLISLCAGWARDLDSAMTHFGIDR